MGPVFYAVYLAKPISKIPHMHTKETWGMHPETGLYASSHGRVITKRKGVHHGSNSSGYRVINYDRKTWRVHRMIAETFVPNPENKSEVNHINGNKADNRADNLEWCTSSENKQHAYNSGLKVSQKGEARYNSKLTEGAVREIKRNDQGLTQEALGELYGVTQSLISRIQRGKKWQHS